MFFTFHNKFKQKKSPYRDKVLHKKLSSPHKSVNAVDLKQQAVDPDTLGTSAATVSLPTGSRKDESRAPWRHCLKNTENTPVKVNVAEDTILQSSDAEKTIVFTEEADGREASVQEASPTPNTPASSEETQFKVDVVEDKILPSSDAEENIFYIKECLGGEADVQDVIATSTATISPPTEARNNKKAEKTPVKEDVAEDPVLPSSDAERNIDFPEEADCGEAIVQEASDIPNIPFSSPTDTTELGINRDIFLIDPPVFRKLITSGYSGSLQEEFNNITFRSVKELAYLGLPNTGQTCYMNSTLQALLTLTHFCQEVYNQRRVWISHPKSDIMRWFVTIADCRLCKGKKTKRFALSAFKHIVADLIPEFYNNIQNDAHEFLSAVLTKMSSMSSELHAIAEMKGITYTCPVEAHITFKMLSTKTCQGCGRVSMTQEDFNSLSLNLVPGGSVSKCLQEYLEESQLECLCECGARELTEKWAFSTLPNVLIFQLQRFEFSLSKMSLTKVMIPITLSKDLVVVPVSGISDMTFYSLMSIISHVGSSPHFGHYICDGAYQPQDSGEWLSDLWLTYNDKHVKTTTGETVCHKRKNDAYLLFYEKRKVKESDRAS